MIEPGQPAPDFTLPNQKGEPVGLSDFRGRKLMLCFYPSDFSPACSEQLSIYQEVLPQIAEAGGVLVAVSTDGSWSHNAFCKQLGLEMTLLSDFHPKGEVTRAYGAYIEERGHPNRSLVLVDGQGVVRWAHAEPTPLTIPGANLIFDALERFSELTSAAVPPVGPDDHVRGEGPEVVLYLDLGCPHCAAAWARISGLSLRLCARHFPLAATRPRSPALHAAAEAASRQSEDAFWAMVDSIYADHGHQDDPHLWERARALGLDLGRFEQDRRGEAVAVRIQADFESGIRAGVTGTPTAFAHGERLNGEIAGRLADLRAL